MSCLNVDGGHVFVRLVNRWSAPRASARTLRPSCTIRVRDAQRLGETERLQSWPQGTIVPFANRAFWRHDRLGKTALTSATCWCHSHSTFLAETRDLQGARASVSHHVRLRAAASGQAVALARPRATETSAAAQTGASRSILPRPFHLSGGGLQAFHLVSRRGLVSPCRIGATRALHSL